MLIEWRDGRREERIDTAAARRQYPQAQRPDLWKTVERGESMVITLLPRAARKEGPAA